MRTANKEIGKNQVELSGLNVISNKLSSTRLVEQVDSLRLAVNETIKPTMRTQYAQFMTPPTVSNFMASMFRIQRSKIHLIDAGAGVGSLTAAFVATMLKRTKPPIELSVTTFEVDPTLITYLQTTMSLCQQACEAVGVKFTSKIYQEDFIKISIEKLYGRLLSLESEVYDCAIMNPPYKKIHSLSPTRRDLRLLGIETGNLYTAFMVLAAQQLKSGGEFVSISPRSFCNGPYFRSFRSRFLNTMIFRRIHVFESRNHAFKDDEVLQENVIIHAIKSPKKPQNATISVSQVPGKRVKSRKVKYDLVINPKDPNLFIHVVSNDIGEKAMVRISQLPACLDDLGLSVSTGRVVDFRVKSQLRQQPGDNTVPLIYPTHFNKGNVRWPNLTTRKPNAIVVDRHTSDLLVPPGLYVLVKRFSAKEERRRIVAVVYDFEQVSNSCVGFENHLNYYHHNGGSLQKELAKGLSVFLNSSVVDTYFRQFSGHTQVNASDLRYLRYPSKKQLMLLAARVPETCDEQNRIDSVIDQILFRKG